LFYMREDRNATEGMRIDSIERKRARRKDTTALGLITVGVSLGRGEPYPD